MNLTARQAVTALKHLDREFAFDVGVKNGQSRAEMEAKLNSRNDNAPEAQTEERKAALAAVMRSNLTGALPDGAGVKVNG